MSSHIPVPFVTIQPTYVSGPGTCAVGGFVCQRTSATFNIPLSVSTFYASPCTYSGTVNPYGLGNLYFNVNCYYDPSTGQYTRSSGTTNGLGTSVCPAQLTCGICARGLTTFPASSTMPQQCGSCPSPFSPDTSHNVCGLYCNNYAGQFIDPATQYTNNPSCVACTSITDPSTEGYAFVGGNKCLPTTCNAGYQPQSNTCAPCTAGQITPTPGSQCQNCPAGQGPSLDRRSCEAVSCTPGSGLSQGVCVACTDSSVWGAGTNLYSGGGTSPCMTCAAPYVTDSVHTTCNAPASQKARLRQRQKSSALTIRQATRQQLARGGMSRKGKDTWR